MKTIDRVNEHVTEISGRAAPAADQQLYYDATVTTSEKHIDGGGYGLDSLDGVELVMALEDSFNVEIPDSIAESDEFRTTGGIAAWLDTNGEG